MGSERVGQSSRRRAGTSILLSLAVFSLLPSARGSIPGSLIWDSGGSNPNAPLDGSGTWNSSIARWSDGSNDSNWNRAKIAVVGDDGIAGTITLGSTITVAGMVFSNVSNGSYLISGAGNALTLGSASTTTVQVLADATIDANLSGSGLTLLGSGTSTLSSGVLKLGSANFYAGDTRINGGLLNLNFSQTGAPASNILPGTGRLTFSSGKLMVTGTGSQQLTATNLNIGSASIGVSNSASLNIGQITHNAGGVVNFTLPDGLQTAFNGIMTSSSNAAGSILGGWAVVGGSTWAAVSSGNVIGLSTFNQNPGTGTSDVDVSPGPGQWTTSTINSLRFNSPGSYTPTLSGQYTIASGGILETANVGANIVNFQTNGPTAHITAGSGNELIVSQFNTAASMMLCPVTDNGNAVSLVKTGPGVLVMPLSSYTGPTTINDGAVQVTTDATSSDLGTPPTTATPNQLILNGGAFSAGANLTINAKRGIGLGPAGGTFTAAVLSDSIHQITYNGIIADATPGVPGSLTKLAASTTFLGGANTFTGTLFLTAGAVQVTTGGSFACSLGLNGGTLSAAAGRTTDLTFNGTTIYPAVSTISAGVALVKNLSLGAITRKTGGIVNFGDTLPSSGAITTTTANANFANGQQTILGGWAIAGGAWAVSGSGSSAGAVSSLPLDSETSVDASAASQLSAGKDINLKGMGTTTTNSITVNSLDYTKGPSTISVNPSNTLTIATGGILVRSSSASSIGGDGNITSGNGHDLIITDTSAPNDSITISANITDNGSVPIGLTWSVIGGAAPALTISGTNTFSGDTVLNSSRTVLASPQALGNSTLNYSNQGGSVSFANSLTSSSFGGIKGSQSLVLPNTANFAFSVGGNNQGTTDSGVITGLTGSGATFTKSGTGSLTLTSAETFPAATIVANGILTLSSSGKLASTMLTVNAGAIANIAGLLTAAPPVNVNGTLTFEINDGVNGTAGQSLTRMLGTLNVGATGLLSIDPTTLANHSSRTVLVAASLSNAGKIDLNNNDLVVRNTIAGTLFDQLKNGFNARLGYWNGTKGIVSSSAATDAQHLSALGFRQSGGSAFDGMNTTISDTLVKYTYFGDANLDGAINGADYQQIDLGFGGNATDWSNGDFNYDGIVNGSDFALIDNTFNQLTATGAGSLAITASSTGLVGGSTDTNAVPEPLEPGLIGLAGWGMVARRRRR